MKVVVLMNFVPPYHVPLLSLLSRRVHSLQVIVSTLMEANRDWEPNWGDLDVIAQRTLTLRSKWRHPAGFVDAQYVHVPLDTMLLLMRYRPDAIISTEMGARSMGAILYRLIHPKTQLLLWLNVSERTERGRGPLRRALRRQMVRAADGVFVDGRSGAQYLRSIGVSDARMHILPYSTDPAFAQTALSRAEDAAKRLLFVGQLAPRKGILAFLDVLCRWASAHPSRPIEMTVVGEGPQGSAVASLVPPGNLSLTLLGSMPYAALAGCYASSGILVFPTLADEWGIVVNEALASGVPVLGSKHSQAVLEMVEEGKTGWIFDPEDPEATYRAIDKVMELLPAEVARMRATCRERALLYAPAKLIEILMAGLKGTSLEEGEGLHEDGKH